MMKVVNVKNNNKLLHLESANFRAALADLASKVKYLAAGKIKKTKRILLCVGQ